MYRQLFVWSVSSFSYRLLWECGVQCLSTTRILQTNHHSLHQLSKQIDKGGGKKKKEKRKKKKEIHCVPSPQLTCPPDIGQVGKRSWQMDTRQTPIIRQKKRVSIMAAENSTSHSTFSTYSRPSFLISIKSFNLLQINICLLNYI